MDNYTKHIKPVLCCSTRVLTFLVLFMFVAIWIFFLCHFHFILKSHTLFNPSYICLLFYSPLFLNTTSVQSFLSVYIPSSRVFSCLIVMVLFFQSSFVFAFVALIQPNYLREAPLGVVQHYGFFSFYCCFVLRFYLRLFLHQISKFSPVSLELHWRLSNLQNIVFRFVPAQLKMVLNNLDQSCCSWHVLTSFRHTIYFQV